MSAPTTWTCHVCRNGNAETYVSCGSCNTVRLRVKQPALGETIGVGDRVNGDTPRSTAPDLADLERAAYSTQSSLATESTLLVDRPTTMGTEVVALFKLAWPMALRLLCRIAMVMTDLMYLGRLGTMELAAASLAVVWMTITSAFLYRGFGTALSTLASQAYGAKSYRSVGMWFQLALVATMVACLPVAASWAATEKIFLGIGIDAPTAARAAQFTLYSIIGLFPLSAYFVIAAYLQAQNNVIPALLVNAFMVGLNVALNQVLIHGAFGWEGLGFIGSPLATSASRWLLLIICATVFFGVMKYHRCTWFGWTREAFARERLKEYVVKQTIPMAVGSCLEEWQLQLIGVFAAWLGDIDIATHNSMMEVFFFMTCIMFGVMGATAIRIGQHLGAGRPRHAQLTSRVAFALAVVMASITAALFAALRNVLGRVFSNDPDVWALAAKLCFVLAVCYILLAVFYVAMATLEGQARPTMVAVAFAVGAWLVAVPLSYVFGFTLHYGLLGLWYGLVCGYALITIIVSVVAYRSDWPKLAALAVQRSTERAKHKPAESEPLLAESGRTEQINA